MDIIEIDGCRYEARVHEGERQVRPLEEWMSAEDFVERLRQLGDWNKIAELAKLGQNIIEGPEW